MSQAQNQRVSGQKRDKKCGLLKREEMNVRVLEDGNKRPEIRPQVGRLAAYRVQWLLDTLQSRQLDSWVWFSK